MMGLVSIASGSSQSTCKEDRLPNFQKHKKKVVKDKKNKGMFYFNLSQVLLNRLRTLEWREKENSLRSLDDFQPNMTDERQLLQVLESIKMTTMKCTCDRERL